MEGAEKTPSLPRQTNERETILVGLGMFSSVHTSDMSKDASVV